MRPIDKTKQSNVKCEHCQNYTDHGECEETGEAKNYWNRCKRFNWKVGKVYKGEDYEVD